MTRYLAIKASKSLFKGDLRVLFYHRVNNYGDRFGIDEESFEKQIWYLCREYKIIGLSEYISIVERGGKTENALLITLDDGYRDNYTCAYKILKKYSVPAAIFLTTDFIDRKIWLWHDIFRYIFEATPTRSLPLTLAGSVRTFNLNDSKQLYSARKYVYDELKNFPYNERIDRLKSLAESLHVDLPDLPVEKYAPLSWDEIREMSENNIEFGAHTCTHEILSRISRDEVYNEIRRSKERIEEELRSRVDAFAYPNGQKADFTAETPLQLRRCGFKLAFTTIPGMNGESTDRYLHNRFSAGNTFGYDFKQIVSGLTTLKSNIKNRLRLFT